MQAAFMKCFFLRELNEELELNLHISGVFDEFNFIYPDRGLSIVEHFIRIGNFNIFEINKANN